VSRRVILVFNYNQQYFLNNLFNSFLASGFLVDNYVFFYDDGSTDQSQNLIKTFTNKNKNTFFHIGLKRNPHVASHGQICGVMALIESGLVQENDVVNFLDADDIYDSSHYNFKFSELDADIYFAKIFNLYAIESSEVKLNRKVGKIKKGIWPTVVQTSGISVTARFLYSDIFIDALTTDKRFNDLWLDARINILAMNDCFTCKYTNSIVFRHLHDNNDSITNKSFLRNIRRQLMSAEFYYMFVKNSLSSSIRLRITYFLSKLYNMLS